MKRADFNRRIEEIVSRLSELSEADTNIIHPRASQPVVLPLDELFAYGERHTERQRLHEELKTLAGERVEE